MDTILGFRRWGTQGVDIHKVESSLGSKRWDTQRANKSKEIRTNQNKSQRNKQKGTATNQIKSQQIMLNDNKSC